MMLYKNTKAMVHSDFFEIVTGIMQGDTFASLLFIICEDYILQTLID